MPVTAYALVYSAFYLWHQRIINMYNEKYKDYYVKRFFLSDLMITPNLCSIQSCPEVWHAIHSILPRNNVAVNHQVRHPVTMYHLQPMYRLR
jgi:hypothetical protein